MNEFLNQQAEQDFHRAQAKALILRIANVFHPGDSDLLPFDEVKRLLKPASETYAGMVSVPLEKIVGSEGRYRDFDRGFLPRRDYLRHRWTSIDRTYYQDIPLPPVRLYEMGGLYFVRDGNHRVSVAKANGQLEIDAEVVSLDSSIRLDPRMGIDELRSEILEWEKKEFMESTGYLQIVGEDDLAFSEPGRYETIREHIVVHKYFLNESETKEIAYEQALFSWHENIYRPIILAIREQRLLSSFPGRTEGDLYLFVVKRWDELKRAYSREIGIGEAASEIRRKGGNGGDRSVTDRDGADPHPAPAKFRILTLFLRRAATVLGKKSITEEKFRK